MKRKTYERNRGFMPGFRTKIKRKNNMSIDITKAKFNQYKTVQKSGMFNMFDPKAREMTTLTKDEWVTIMQDYEKLNAAWGKDDEN
tara:strand:- start:518 stop:775 length:258 start_codon:yes stop_codon:yes gene_type:complete